MKFKIFKKWRDLDFGDFLIKRDEAEFFHPQFYRLMTFPQNVFLVRCDSYPFNDKNLLDRAINVWTEANNGTNIELPENYLKVVKL